MEYTQDIVVNLPRERFLELFDNPDTMSQWMEGLLAFEPLTGVPGADRATSKLTFKRGRGTMDMLETIVRRRLPDHFDANYDAKGVHNICENQFIEVGPASTRWVAHNIFEMRGFMKVIGLSLAPASARKATRPWNRSRPLPRPGPRDPVAAAAR